MTQNVAKMAVVVRAVGVSEAFYNGQRDRVVEAIRREMQQQKEQLEVQLAQERERADEQTRECNRMRKDRLVDFVAHLTRRRGPIWKLKDAIATAWAYVYGITVGGVWVEMGERAGLWEYIGDD